MSEVWKHRTCQQLVKSYNLEKMTNLKEEKKKDEYYSFL